MSEVESLVMSISNSKNEIEAIVPALRDAHAKVHQLEKKLADQIGKQSKDIKQVSASLQSSSSSSLSSDRVAALKSELQSASKTNTAASSLLPNAGAKFIRFFIGSHINLVLNDPKKKRLFKEEYEALKFKTTLYIFPPIFYFFFFPNRPLETIYQLFLVFYYTTITIRENILIANGSNIKRWWLFHHYVSICITLSLMLWPSGESYDQFHTQFYVYALYTGVIQMLQYFYQKGRLYTLTALGQAKEMDVVNTDSSQIILWRSFLLLLPFLFVGHAFQLFNSYTLARLYIKNWPTVGEWPIAALSILFAVVGLGNLITTWTVVRNKVRSSKQKAL